MLDGGSGCCGQSCGCPRKVEGLCGGCKGNGCNHYKKVLDLTDITDEEQYFINLLEEFCYLPIWEVRGIDVLPIFIEKETQTLEETIFFAKVLTKLEKQGVLSLDYEIPLTNYDYEKEFAIESFLKSQNENCTSIRRQGSMALTQEYFLNIDDCYEDKIQCMDS